MLNQTIWKIPQEKIKILGNSGAHDWNETTFEQKKLKKNRWISTMVDFQQQNTQAAIDKQYHMNS